MVKSLFEKKGGVKRLDEARYLLIDLLEHQESMKVFPKNGKE